MYAFYSYWQYFSTLKQFAYADVYNPNQAPNRRIKRIIENENLKERAKERKLFNDEIIKLVEYVRKRDPRYQRFRAQELREKELKRKQEEEERERRKQEEAERLRVYREELAKRYADQEKEDLESGNYVEEVIEEFKCQVCKKTFKNYKQM